MALPANPMCLSEIPGGPYVLGIPSFENTKVAKFPFHFFDRYEIHIQDFVDLYLTFVILFPILIFVKFD